LSSKKRLNSIKSGTLSRGFALAKLSVTAGARAASYALESALGGEDNKADRLKAHLTSQASALARELGQLKGSLMKAGQLLSTYGEYFLPPEVNALLKTLQNQSPPLEWKEIERVLVRQLGKEKLALLEIDPEPIASASLGQVHRARKRGDSRWLAMKIQYPGVDRAIDSDLKVLRSMLSMSKLLPGGPRYDSLFKEVREMLHREVDYTKEFENTVFFRNALASDYRYVVPEPVQEFSTSRIMTTALQEGVGLGSDEVRALPQEERNALAEAALELYLRELFEWGMVQTDPHFGNYQVQWMEDPATGKRTPRLVLFDFGAVRKLSRSFLDAYQGMVRGAYLRDPVLLEKAALQLGFLEKDDPQELREDFINLCYLITEPFEQRPSGDPYDWGKSDLPQRVAKQGSKIVLGFKMRVPPREIVFLDRKMGGIFIILSSLNARINGREILAKFLEATYD
jgi:predicted unusual protein kinase regulating ubiquinone biosynthesis (AarF/ABC1/UbiB family)